ncbi:hypothetical protein QCA50_008099 [Cerrena zonata]|uniref:Uncharacterized protein n=1 Tax=Cerrena zonata TaxID=2478898 RepID=A0AAW0GGD3_9APHY
MLLAVFLVSILSRLTSSRAQDYSIPLQWVNTTSPLSHDVRVQFAEQVFDSLSPSYDSSSGQIQALGLGQNANLLSATAIFDSIVSDNETKNYNVTTDRLSRAKSQVVPA